MEINEPSGEVAIESQSMTATKTITLIGMMGSGKSTLGRLLASSLGYAFKDSDLEIEHQTGCTVRSLIETRGEAKFRELEACVIRQLLHTPRMVLATGGGAVLTASTLDRLTRTCLIWLDAPIDVLAHRLKGLSDRPLLLGSDPEVKLRSLYEARKPLYSRAAIRVCTHGSDPEEICSKIKNALTFPDPVENRMTQIRRTNSLNSILPPTPVPDFDSGELAHEHALDESMPHLTLRIDLGSRSYPILIGEHTTSLIPELLKERSQIERAAIIADSLVWSRYGESFRGESTLAHAPVFEVTPGEASKSFSWLEQACTFLIDNNLSRSDLVVAFGGGVVGDLAGFASAIVKRGLPVLHVPTTLLAQVDSSVGGKTGINTPAGKNLVGSFWQPTAVVADLHYLNSLPSREFASGMAEVIKYGAIRHADFFHDLESVETSPRPSLSALATIVCRCCEAKGKIVQADEVETGERALLNFGHTFAHAFESIWGYDGSLLHGEAVAIGMIYASVLSTRTGLCTAGDTKRLAKLLEAFELPTGLKQLSDRPWNPQQILEYMTRDKKNIGGNLTLILSHGIGDCRVHGNYSVDSLTQFLIEAGYEPMRLVS